MKKLLMGLFVFSFLVVGLKVSIAEAVDSQVTLFLGNTQSVVFNGQNLELELKTLDGSTGIYSLEVNGILKSASSFGAELSITDSVSLKGISYSAINSVTQSVTLQLLEKISPSITLESNPQASNGTVTINLGDSITFIGFPNNLTGQNGVDYTMSFNFDPIFNDVCNQDGIHVLSQKCTPTQAGTGTFSIQVTQNGQIYNSNIIKVVVKPVSSIDIGCQSGQVYSSTTGQACSINTPSITVLSPNGGEVYQIGQQINVKWRTTGITSNNNMEINLYVPETGYHYYLTKNTYNDGTEIFIIPSDVPLGHYQMSVYADVPYMGTTKGFIGYSNLITINSSTDNGCSNGEIYSSTTGQKCPSTTPSITVLSPNGGETFSLEETFWPTWKYNNVSNVSSSAPSSVSIIDLANPNVEYSVGQGEIGFGTRINYTSSIAQAPSLGKKNFKLKVLFNGISDLSDNTFTITSAITTPSITVLSPNGGETFVQGKSNIIYWSGGMHKIKVGLFQPVSSPQDNFYGVTGVIGWININATPSDSKITWDGIKLKDYNGFAVTDAKPGQYKIVVISEGEEGLYCVSTDERCRFDLSDSIFTITSSTDNGCLSSEGYSSITGQKCPENNNPVISGVSGPQKLNVNQTGTWMVKASSSTVGNLSYSVVWGDEGYQLYAMSSVQPITNTQQSSTFTHSYAQAGTYTPTFTVTSENTIRCITTPCPSNGGSATTSLSVKVGSSVYPLGCNSTEGYSYTTGLACDGSQGNGIDGCLPGQNYSSTTGQACQVIVDNGCNGTMFSTITGKLCPVTNTNTSTSIRRTLKRGIKGDDVKILQLFLNLAADGSFGPQTQAKVIEWQAQNGLKVDGLFGVQSATKAGLVD